MKENENKTAVALGYFDGLHIAHQRVLDAALMQRKNGLTPVVILFDQPPAAVVRHVKVARLMADEDRDAALTNMGFVLKKLSFEAIRDLSPEAFVQTVLTEELHAGFVSCGFNYHFGRNGSGNAQMLSALCACCGIGVHISEEMRLLGESVSSTRIRLAVQAGQMDLANTLIGRPLYFTSPVFSGDHRGRLLGAPTINQYLPDDFVRPKFGVYVSEVLVEGTVFRGVTNIGCRPTFDGESVRSETYILGYQGNLYGARVRTALLHFLRPEIRFPSFDALKEQIAKDAASAAEFQKNK